MLSELELLLVNKAIDLDLFQDRNRLCEKHADIVVDSFDYDLNKIVDSIIVEILKFFD